MKLSSLPILIMLLLTVSALPASAQPGYSGWHRGWLRPGERLGGAGFHGQIGGRGGWSGGRGNGYGYAGTGYGGANPAAFAVFDSRANRLRGEIAARASSRGLSPQQAYRMNQELNSLMAMRAQITASGGGNPGDLANLNARLVQLQMGLRSPISF